MMLAQIEQLDGSWLKNLAIFVVCASGTAFYLKGIFGKKAPVPQPFAVEITKQLNELFADKKTFEEHAEHNTERHAQLFNKIDRVEREAREAMERRFTALNAERTESLEKLNEQFVFIRENIAAINRELQLRHKS